MHTYPPAPANEFKIPLSAEAHAAVFFLFFIFVILTFLKSLPLLKALVLNVMQG